MKVETVINQNNSLSYLASQRLANGKLVLVESDNRIEAMAGVMQRSCELTFGYCCYTTEQYAAILMS